jgi:hypothetical protein
MQHLEEGNKNIHLPIMRLSSKAHDLLVGTGQKLQIIRYRGIHRSYQKGQGKLP